MPFDPDTLGGTNGGDFQIAAFELLQSIDGFNKLTRVFGELVISQCLNLRSVQGFSALTEAGDITFGGLPELDNLPELPALTTINGARAQEPGLKIDGTNVLDIPGLNSLANFIGAIRISNNQQLNDISGFNGLVDGGGQLPPSSLQLGIFIESNSLNTITGFTQLTTASSLRLLNNPNLERADGVRAAATRRRGTLRLARTTFLTPGRPV